MTKRPKKSRPKSSKSTRHSKVTKKKRGNRKDVLKNLRRVEQWCDIDRGDSAKELVAVEKKGAKLKKSKHKYLYQTQLGCERVYHYVLHEYLYGDPGKRIKKLREKLNLKPRSTQSLFGLMNEKYLGLKGATNSRAKSVQEFAAANQIAPQNFNRFIYDHGGYSKCAEKASAFFRGEKPKSKPKVPRVVVATEVKQGVKKLVEENDILVFKAEQGEKTIHLNAVYSDELLHRAVQRLMDTGQSKNRYGDWS